MMKSKEKKKGIIRFMKQSLINEESYIQIEYIDKIIIELTNLAIKNGYTKSQAKYDTIKNHLKNDIKNLVVKKINDFIKDTSNVKSYHSNLYEKLISPNIKESHKNFYKGIIKECINDIYNKYLICNSLCISCECEIEDDVECEEKKCIANKNICCDCNDLRSCKECGSFVHNQCLENKGNCEECEEIYCNICNPIITSSDINNCNEIYIHKSHATFIECKECKKSLVKEVGDIKVCKFCNEYYCHDCE